MYCPCGNRKSRISCVEFEKQMTLLLQQTQERRNSSDSSDTDANGGKNEKSGGVSILKRPALSAESDPNQIIIRQNSQDKYQWWVHHTTDALLHYLYHLVESVLVSIVMLNANASKGTNSWQRRWRLKLLI